jgi:hypothetical protein
MKNFKFLRGLKEFDVQELVPRTYEGQWSEWAIGFLIDYMNSVNRFQTIYDNGRVKVVIVDVNFVYGGMTSYKVEVYPYNPNNIRVVYNINAGNCYPYVTEQTIESI